MSFLQKSAYLILAMDKLKSAVYNASYKAEIHLQVNLFLREDRFYHKPERKPVVIFLYSCRMIRGKIQIMSEEKRKSRSADFIVCDEQTEYAEHLFRILEEHFGKSYQFHLFHNVDRMEEYVEEKGADVLVIGEEFAENIGNSSDVRKMFVLTGKREDIRAESEVNQEDKVKRCIFRYQPAGDIIKTVKKGLGEVRKSERKRMAGQNQSKIIVKPRIRDSPAVRGLIGVYSPIHRIGKTKFALRIGQKMAEKSSVLYLNLEGYSGYEYYFPDGAQTDLGDILYCMKQERSDYGLKISSMTGQIGRMDFIKPMENEQDLRSVRLEEWIALFDMILEKCIYDTVILDLGDCVDGLYEILRRCVKVYTPYIRDGISEAKLQQYEDNLRQTGYEDILSRTVKRVMKSGRAKERSGAAE